MENDKLLQPHGQDIVREISGKPPQNKNSSVTFSPLYLPDWNKVT